MPVLDVVATIEIPAEPADIAAVMFDPAREPEWVSAVTGVQMIDPALAPGARVRRTGRVLDREVAWTTAVEVAQFPHVLALRVTEGPFAGLVIYEIQRAGGGCRIGVRLVGDPVGLDSETSAGLLEAPIRSALSDALTRLRAVVVGGRGA